MKSWTRRRFGIAAALSGLAATPRSAWCHAKARVVVIGGGIGGVTLARYLALSDKTIDITLIEPKTHYTTCVASNLYLAGLRSFESLTYEYDTLADRYGIKLVRDNARAIDPAAKRVLLARGLQLQYDRLVVSPGIAFKQSAIVGYDEAATRVMPHAWTAGPQMTLLRAQLEAMEDGGVFVITAPPSPYRCPSAPYERASLAAYYFKQFKPRSKILILDAKGSFFGQELFQDGWNRHYPGMVEWLAPQAVGGVTAVDVKTRSVITPNNALKAAVANVIPPQTAGDIARNAGLADASGWCPVDPTTLESTLVSGVHVVGDAASAGGMPKSAFCANSQAKACAFAIVAELTGSTPPTAHLFDAGFTYLAGNDAVSDVTSFTPSDGAIKIDRHFMSKVGEPPDTRRRNVREANAWYDAFNRDVFG